MRKLLLLLFFLPICLNAQNSTIVTTAAAVRDSSGVIWPNGTYTFTFAGPANAAWPGGNLPKTITGNLDNNGGFTQSVPNNNTINPGPSTWTLTVCPSPAVTSGQAQCSINTGILVSGATQQLTVSPNPIKIAGTTKPWVAAYSDSEIVAPIPVGFIYFNVSLNGNRTCETVDTNGNCTSWVAVGTTAAVGVSSLNTLSGALNILAGTGINVTTGNNDITVAANPPPNVSSLNTFTGDLAITAGLNMAVTATAPNIQVATVPTPTFTYVLLSTGNTSQPTIKISAGNGSPNGVVTGNPGDMYLNDVAGLDTKTITTTQTANGTATYTSANDFAVGQILTINNCAKAQYNGTFAVVTASATQFTTVGAKGSDGPNTESGATASANNTLFVKQSGTGTNTGWVAK